MFPATFGATAPGDVVGRAPLLPSATMPLSYVIDCAHGIVFSRAWGVLTFEDLRDHYFRMSIDPDFDPDFCQLADNREVHAVEMDPQTIRRLAHITVFSPGRPRALVVAGEVPYGLARMYAIFSETEGQKVAVFREPVDALQWLLCVTDLPAAALSLPVAGATLAPVPAPRPAPEQRA